MEVVNMTPVDPILSPACSSVGQSVPPEHTPVSVASEQEMKTILAERYKTKLCRNYVETGACPYDIRCMFAHGVHELRTPQMNINDGLLTEEAIRMFQRQWRSVVLSSSAPPTVFWPHYCGYPALPPLCEAGCPCACGCDVPAPTLATGMMAEPLFYTHDTYNCHVLPCESRFYSNPPLPHTMPCDGCCAWGRCVSRRRANPEARRITVEIPAGRFSAQRGRGDGEDAELSSCSSLGGVSCDQQPFAPDSTRAKPSRAPDSDAVEAEEL